MSLKKKNNAAKGETIKDTEIRMEGILSQGYGNIYKSVMFDTDLTYKDKVLWAYLASYTGSGNHAFPSTRKIKEDLHCGNDLLYKMLHHLTELKFIRIKKEKTADNGFEKNIYYLNPNPKKETGDVSYYDGDHEYRASIEGYGSIPQSVIRSGLSMGAKAEYCLFCSYCGGMASNCYPSRAAILYFLQIGVSAHTRFLHELVENNYIETAPRRDSRNKMAGQVYTIVQFPDPSKNLKAKAQKGDISSQNNFLGVGNRNSSAEPILEKSAEKSRLFEPDEESDCSYSECPENERTGNGGTQNRCTNNNKYNKVPAAGSGLELHGTLGSNGEYKNFIQEKANYIKFILKQVAKTKTICGDYIKPQNKSKLVGLVVGLTNDEASEFLIQEFAGAEEALNIFRHCLIELLSQPVTKCMKGKKQVTNDSILQSVNHILYCNDGRVSLSGYAQMIIPSFLSRMEGKSTNHKINYMRLLIINSFNEFYHWQLDCVNVLPEIDDNYKEHFVVGGFLNREILDFDFLTNIYSEEHKESF